MDTLVGRRLGKYQIETLVGRGGMAAVYRAHDTVLNRSVAIKVLEPALAIDPTAVERFRREAVTSANLEHPSIVRVFDVQKEGDLHFIAMRYVQGTTLRNILRDNGALPLDAIVNIVKPVAAALHYAHQRGVVHRDVKPGNILVEPDGAVLLTDFGIARAADNSQSALTATGQVMGTADYLAPEQISGRPAEARSDIYSLGVVLYEMLTGVTPFAGETTASILYRQVHDKPVPLRSVNPRLPAELQPIVDRALAKNPASRYADALDLARELEEVAGWLPPGSPWLMGGGPQTTIAVNDGGRDGGRRPSGALYPPTPRPVVAHAHQATHPQTGPLPYVEEIGEFGESYQPRQIIAPPRIGKRSGFALVVAILLLLAGVIVLAIAAGLLPVPGFGSGSRPGSQGRFQPPRPSGYTGLLRKGNGSDIHIPQALVPPIIDGDLSDWAGSSPNPFPAKYITFSKRKWGGPDDLSADYYFAWDASNFYVGAIVTDNVHVQLPTTRGDVLWKGDDIEIWFDTDLSGDFAKKEGDADDYQLGLSPGNFEALGPEAMFWYPAKSPENARLVHVAARRRVSNSGYMLEAAVPWTTLGNFRPQPGQAIGFAASAGDDDQPNKPSQELMMSTAPTLIHDQPPTFGNLFF